MIASDPQTPLRFGLIGIDSPHAPSFTRLLANGRDGDVRGGTIVSAWRGVVSEDFPLSRDRIDDFDEQLRKLGVQMRDDAESVAEESDALLIVASDARTHRSYFERVAPYGKPVFVDTRFALSVEDARAMLELANKHGALPLAGSPKRFTPEFRSCQGGGRIERIDLTGPLPTQPGHPGLAWYGVHQVDLAVAALGVGCFSVDARGSRILLHWADGRIATLGGEPEWSPLTVGQLDITDPSAGQQSAFSIEANESMLVGIVEAIVDACRTGIAPVAENEILEVVAIVEAANQSIIDGRPVAVRR